MWFNARIVFLKKLREQPLTNGSITPSSRYLARAMIHGIDFTKIHTIVEFWPWTWSFTKLVVDRMHKSTTFICVEVDEEYVKLLHTLYGHHIIIEHTNVTDLPAILSKHNIAKVDLIISGLPFQVYTHSLINSLAVLIKQGTVFRWFSYTPYWVRKIYKWLPLQHKKMVIHNIPPAFVFGPNYISHIYRE